MNLRCVNLNESLTFIFGISIAAAGLWSVTNWTISMFSLDTLKYIRTAMGNYRSDGERISPDSNLAVYVDMDRELKPRYPRSKCKMVGGIKTYRQMM